MQPDLLDKQILLAPMAGVTDRPFRAVCRDLGADACVSEMISANPALYDTRKSRLRRNFDGEASPRIVQIAGADPAWLAEAALFNIGHGAEVIDINMGCPAKKVCNVMAGSSLLRDEPLVGRILDKVVAVSSVPVTLKIRTGWDPQNRNAVRIARIAENAGIRSLVVHGRTRACKFNGQAEHDTTAAVKAAVAIPVIANGDITSAEEAIRVLRHTGADGVMIGRAALGNPWFFREIKQLLATGQQAPRPGLREMGTVLAAQLEDMYGFYGEYTGVRTARKHIAWYCAGLPGANALRALVNQEERGDRQLRLVKDYFNTAAQELLAA